MTNIPGNRELADIAHEAEVEREAAEATTGMEAAEYGYYEAELQSLRDAATSLQTPGTSD